MKSLLASLALCLLSVPAWAEQVAVHVLDAGGGVSVGQAALIERAAQDALREQSALTLAPAEATAAPPRKGCTSDAACLEALPEKGGVEHAFVLRPRLTGGKLSLDAFWVDGRRQSLQTRQAKDVEEPEAAVRTLVTQVLPGHARRGYGGLWVAAAPGSVVKVDGRKVATAPLDAPLVLPAGSYGVDVVAPSGEAVYRSERVLEGERLALTFPAGDAARPGGMGAENGSEVLMWTSYGLWGAGAVAVAGAFVAGLMGRRAEGRIDPCTASSRDCSTLAEARHHQQRSEVYARAANRLVGAGVILGTGGAALYGYGRHHAAVRQRKEAQGAAPAARSAPASRGAGVNTSATPDAAAAAKKRAARPGGKPAAVTPSSTFDAEEGR